MPTWGEILRELQATRGPSGQPDFDAMRRSYLRALSAYTRRSTILYATDFLSGSADPNAVSINLGDMQALMEVVKDLPGPTLDLVLHTPDGRPISRDEARARGIRITDLEADQMLQDAVLSVHHATMHTLAATAAAKIVETTWGAPTRCLPPRCSPSPHAGPRRRKRRQPSLGLQGSLCGERPQSGRR